nr:hypothetical protein CKG001_07040 [Bdellovibrio sp. CKG001]BFD62023.1 hypothetical protein BdHM001_07040 [Bdellovibrio sp. HM001]BFD65865.1 hypothetical protein HAGR004_08870 [Bdellovibrio sp. HAGR004]
MLRYLKHITILLAALLVFEVSFAQSTSRSTTTTTTTTAKKKATLSFEDELVEGSTQKPELFYLFQKKNFNYKRLIKLRENFLPEMRRTTEDIQRVRGAN